jgi:hypothetical protein
MLKPPPTQGGPTSSGAANWGDQIAVETLGGIPYRMYSERPRNVADLLALAERWGGRPHIIQGDRVFSFNDLLAAVRAKTAALIDLDVKRGDRVFILGWSSPEGVLNFGPAFVPVRYPFSPTPGGARMKSPGGWLRWSQP